MGFDGVIALTTYASLPHPVLQMQQRPSFQQWWQCGPSIFGTSSYLATTLGFNNRQTADVLEKTGS